MQGQVYKEDQAAERLLAEKVSKLEQEVAELKKLVHELKKRTRWMKTY